MKHPSNDHKDPLMNKNPQTFLGIKHMLREILPLHKLQDHSYQ